MKKQKTRKQNNQNNQKPNKKTIDPFLISTIILTVVSIVLGGFLSYSCSKMKTSEDEEYLAVYPHLMKRIPPQDCEITRLSALDENMPQDVSHVCTITSYGVTDDGNPYVSYEDQSYDKKTHEAVGEPKRQTLYFQHHANGDGEYSEALGFDS